MFFSRVGAQTIQINDGGQRREFRYEERPVTAQALSSNEILLFETGKAHPKPRRLTAKVLVQLRPESNPNTVAAEMSASAVQAAGVEGYFIFYTADPRSSLALVARLRAHSSVLQADPLLTNV